MKTDNPGWGAPRIHGELLALGLEVSEPTVSRELKASAAVAAARFGERGSRERTRDSHGRSGHGVIMLRRPCSGLQYPTAATTTPTATGFPIRTARFRRRRLRLRTDTDGASLKTAVASQRLPLAATVAAGVAFDYRFDQFQAELGRKRRSRRLLTTRPHRGWNSIAVAIGVSLE